MSLIDKKVFICSLVYIFVKKVVVMPRGRRKRRGRRGRMDRDGVKKYIGAVSFAVPFVQQITEKDTLTNSSYVAMGAVDKIKFLSNSLLGRTVGFQPFADKVISGASPHLSSANVVNKWTTAGVAAYLYGRFAPKGMPGKGILKKAGSHAALAGIIGGALDDKADLPPPSMSYGTGPGKNPLAPRSG